MEEGTKLSFEADIDCFLVTTGGQNGKRDEAGIERFGPVDSCATLGYGPIDVMPGAGVPVAVLATAVVLRGPCAGVRKRLRA